MPQITINGTPVEAPEDSYVLEAIESLGIEVPTLCHHPALTPVGVCKVCVVEVALPGKKPRVRPSCILKPKEGMDIQTHSERVQKARTRAFRKLLRYAPESEKIYHLAEKFNVHLGPVPDDCIRCQICIRACSEIVGVGALAMDDLDNVVPVAGDKCIGCGTCANLCPTGAIRMEDKDGLRTIYIRDEIIGRHALVKCEACGRLFATQKFLDRVAERTGEHPHVKESHRYCPTCAKLLSDRVKSSKKIKRM
ncbi:MAG: (2Fe-2S)-binding protein [Desulfobacterales bacterium]|nr:(2Fe-2S)-binding protein [Desulfobacterales bacterium]